jgi:predicted CXXCH cytochrome family protein
MHGCTRSAGNADTHSRESTPEGNMRIKTAALLVMLGTFLLQASLLSAADEGFRILHPADRSSVRTERIRVIGVVRNPAITSLLCQVKGGEVVGNRTISVTDGAFTVLVQLARGVNELSIVEQKSGLTQKISVYLARDTTRPPDGFRPYFSHAPIEKEDQCGDCHNLKVKPVSYKRLTPSATCVTARCHSGMGKGKFVHGPIGSGSCTACHNSHGTTNQHMVSRPGDAGCYTCHDTKKAEFKGQVIHAPVASGGCTECHDAHQSDLKFQLKGTSLQGLCLTCHDANLVRSANLHTPVKEGNCTVCHNAHASSYRALLGSPADTVCFSCHEDAKKGLAQKYVHKPVKEGCQKCHDPHGSSQKASLHKAAQVLCVECHRSLHEKTIQALSTAKYPHSPVQNGTCGSCHSPHFSNDEKLLKAPLTQICFTCHKDLGEKTKSSQFTHGPVSGNDCVACHETHGSPYPRILRSYFPAEFYVPYKLENYAICFDCHNKDIALRPTTSELTGFRNGERNLHFVHVNKEKKGRSCKACHEVHAGNQAMHIRQEVPFGETWSYPIRYTKTPSGGSCVVGCHKPFAYDRTKPVRY